jgi:hypothetical protein
MSKRAVGITAAGVAGVAAAAAALAFAGTRQRARRRADRPGEVESRGEAHMWGIVAGREPAEQVLD